MRARLVIGLLLVAAAGLVVWTRFGSMDGIDRDDGGDGGGTVDDTPGDDRPGEHRVADFAGKVIAIDLLSAPATHYATRASGDGGDAGTYRRLVAAIGGPAVVYDPDLAHAAGEVAYQIALHGRPPPEAAMTFVLHASGAPELGAAQYYTHTTSDGEEVLRETIERALESLPPGEGAVRVGVGEASTPDQKYTRHISVLVTRRAYEIEPAPRHVERGGTWTLRGRLPAGFRDPVATALRPSGELVRADIEVRGDRFELRAPAGDTEGTMSVGVDGVGRTGPGKLLQLSVEVGDGLPRSFSVRVPEADPEFESLEDAEQYALALLQLDRAAAGLDSLEHDDELSAIARAHSRDMRDRNFFGHYSTSTGLASDRLRAAGYRAYAHAENLARNDTLGEAEASLMASVGHRANIVKPEWTEVGIGAAQRDDGEWYLTQLFARKVVPIDPAEAAAALLARINDSREAGGSRPLRRDDALTAIAARHAGDAAEEDVDGLASAVGDDLRRRANIRAGISVHAVYDTGDFALPPMVLDPAMNAVGIGVHQSPDDLHGRTGVVIIVGRRR